MTIRPSRAPRRPFPKGTREAVHAKFGGRCAYCGCELTTRKDMQIDHLVPLHRGGTDDMPNLMPSCRACNFYKSTCTLEEFRGNLSKLFTERPGREFRMRLSLKYGVVVMGSPWDGKFHFEKYKEKENE